MMSELTTTASRYLIQMNDNIRYALSSNVHELDHNELKNILKELCIKQIRNAVKCSKLTPDEAEYMVTDLGVTISSSTNEKLKTLEDYGGK